MQMGTIQGIRGQMTGMMPNVRMNAMQQANMAAGGMNPNAISELIELHFFGP